MSQGPPGDIFGRWCRRRHVCDSAALTRHNGRVPNLQHLRAPFSRAYLGRRISRRHLPSVNYGMYTSLSLDVVPRNMRTLASRPGSRQGFYIRFTFQNISCVCCSVRFVAFSIIHSGLQHLREVSHNCRLTTRTSQHHHVGIINPSPRYCYCGRIREGSNFPAQLPLATSCDDLHIIISTWCH